MTDKELKRLSRIELLEIIHMLQENEQRLIKENQKLTEELNGRRELLAKNKTFSDIAENLDEAVEHLHAVAKQYQLLLESEGSKVLSILCSPEDE